MKTLFNAFKSRASKFDFFSEFGPFIEYKIASMNKKFFSKGSIFFLFLSCLLLADQRPNKRHDYFSAQPVKRPVANAEEVEEESEFTCVKADSGGFQPKRILLNGEKTDKFPPLGRKGVSKEECETAVKNARNGVVCSHTLLGWKPTHFSGFVESRRGLGKENHGFYGVSIEGPNALETCIKATRLSTAEKVCFWNGDGWLVGLVSGKQGGGSGRFKDLDSCIENINSQKRKTTRVGLFSLLKPQDRSDGHESWSLSTCNQCHSSTRYPIPDWAMDRESFEQQLKDPKTATEAQAWLGRLHNHLNVQKDMPPSLAAKNAMAASHEGRAFLKFIREQYEALNPKAPANPNSEKEISVERSKEVQILPQNRLEHYRSILPSVSDPEVDKALKNENTFFYDEASLPSGYQDASKSVVGVRKSGDSTFVKGAPFMDPTTKKLKVFSHGVGIDPHSKAETFHFIQRPQKEDGSFEKIKVKKTRGSDYREDGETWKWEFPIGTISGEVITEKDSQGKAHVLEIRTRKKTGKGKDGWESNIFRPFTSEEDLLEELEAFKDDPGVGEESKKISEALKNGKLDRVKIDNQGFRVSGISFEGHTQTLPDMSEELVKKLLDRTFESSLGSVWKKSEEVEAFAPTTRQSFGLVPQNSKTGALRVDSESCNSCHRYTNTPLGYLYPGRSGKLDDLLRNTTDAYGNTGGNDGQFRWHPFDPALMGRFSQVPDNRKVRPEFKSWLEFTN